MEMPHRLSISNESSLTTNVVIIVQASTLFSNPPNGIALGSNSIIEPGREKFAPQLEKMEYGVIVDGERE